MANYPCKDDTESRHHLAQALGIIPADLDVTKWERARQIYGHFQTGQSMWEK